MNYYKRINIQSLFDYILFKTKFLLVNKSEYHNNAGSNCFEHLMQY